MRSKPRHPLAAVSAFLVLVSATAFAAAAAAQLPTPSVGVASVRSQRFENENLLGFYTPQAHDELGYAVAAGDFNGDGADDLATGIPFDNGLADSPLVDSGSVVVRYGIPGVGLATSLAGTVLRQLPVLDPPEEFDELGRALVACNFNGDLFDDLAVGSPSEDLDELAAGAVQIHFGGSNGLAPADRFYTQATPGIPGDPEFLDRFGLTLACGDFNADGFDDLVIGVPDEDIGGTIGGAILAGMIDIVPGSPSGPDPTAAIYLSQDVGGVGGSAEEFDEFGQGLAVGDFDNDGFDDLAVGSPGEDDDQGAIHVFFGGRLGLGTAGSLFYMETFLGGDSEDDDLFGYTLAAADFDGDGFDDLAVGIPGEDVGDEVNAGKIGVLYGFPGGFELPRTHFWDEDHLWGLGASEQPDRFGWGLAAGDFDKDGLADLAVGHQDEEVAGQPGAGAATVLMGRFPQLGGERARIIAAGVEGFPGQLGGNKALGLSLASGDFDGDGHADLAIGAPIDDVGSVPNAGSEMVLYGSLFSDGAETGDTTLWSETRTSPTTTIEVTKDARLGPLTSRSGIQVNLGGVSRTTPSIAYVRVGPDRGFNAERRLSGSFFVDPLNVTMTPGADIFQMMAFADSLAPGGKTHLAFDLVRTPGNYSLLVNFRNEAVNALQFAGSGVITDAGDPNGHNTRIDYEWRGGSPGHLTVWKTRFIGGVPDANGKVMFFSVDLPNTQNAVINHVLAGVVQGQDSGTFGKLYLDELSFRR